MRHARYAALAGALLLAAPLNAQSEEDGGGFIQRFLQDKLSSAGREVQIRGFEGLLGGQARLRELTIADADGIWLTLRDARLDWSRAALLRGNLLVDTLSAGEIILDRLPAPASPDEKALPEAPKAEAPGFALPELPVSIRIDNLAIDRAEIGQAVMGEAATLTFDGSVRLADGEGDVSLVTRRLDGPDDDISLAGGFSNETRVLSLDLSMEETGGGLVGRMLKLPGAPSLAFFVRGEGPLDDFTADIGLQTDGEDRIAGRVALAGDGAGGSTFDADLGGNVTPLLPEEFHPFFGEELRLSAAGSRSADGVLNLPDVSLSTAALDLAGSLRLGADGLPTAFDLSGEIGDADGKPLRLPVSGPGTFIDRAAITAGFDSAQSDRWTLVADVEGLSAETVALDRLGLDGVGRISRENGASVTADLIFDVSGLALADPGLSEAIGDAFTGGSSLTWQQGGALEVTRLYLDGADYGTTMLGQVRVAQRSLKLSGEGRLRADDISRFSTLAGRPLTGNAALDIAGQGDPLGGQFAIEADVTATGLSIGQETADRLLDGPVTISTTARRDTEGTRLDHLDLRSRAVTLDARGEVGSGRSDVSFEAALTDVSLVLPGHEGEATLAGNARETEPGDWQVGMDLTGPYALTGWVGGRVKPGESDVSLDLSIPDIAPLVPGHEGPLNVNGRAVEAAEGAWDVDLDLAGPYELAAAVVGRVNPGATDVDLDINLPDIAPLVPGHSGAVALKGNAAETGTGGWRFRLGGDGPYESSVDFDAAVGDGPGTVNFRAALPDVAPLAPGVTGPFSAEGTASETGGGRWNVDFDASGPYDAMAAIKGVAGGGQSDLALDVSVPDLGRLVPQMPQLAGPLRARGTAAEAGDGRWKIDFDASGPQAATAALNGLVGATGSDVALSLALPRVSAFAPGVPGSLRADITAKQDADSVWQVGLDATGPYRSSVTADASYGGTETRVDFRAGLPDIGALAPAYSGPISLEGSANSADLALWNVLLDAGLPYNGTASVAGRVAGGDTELKLSLSLPSIAPFAPGLVGGVSADGTVSQATGGYRVSLNTRGPQSASTTISGTVAQDFATVALSARGTAPLALANAAISPRALLGTAAFDISVNGRPALDSVSGNVTVNGAELVLPTLRQRFTGINIGVGLSGGNIRLDASAQNTSGGGVAASGTIALASLAADLRATLDGLVLADPTLFTTTLNGALSVSGPLTGGAAITGRVDVGRTEIRVPDGGLGFGGTIPDMRHVNEPGAVYLTRQRAGLVETERSSSGGGGGGGPAFRLDVTVNAPEQIFIRGRGLDAELGGALLVRGTTAVPEPVGEIELIRGRLDILGQRLNMTNGLVTLAGGLTPYMNLTASATREEFEILVQIIGPIDDPEFNLSSVPPLPEDEVLAHFLFGKSVTDLSPFQAVQLANAVAQLTGRGGIGLLGGIREGLGLDDLDIAEGDDGSTEVRAGKYISDRIYTEFVADSDGDTEVDVNIDVTKYFTIRGTADSNGESAIGIYFERDY
ncbi:translocation/assembly module TamB domain-containing protein [Tropicimonas sp. IMCC6043]|uniref:translocation/assembly module TamB domain-containing protein n=1 Tax=Tropicimonas sp. IMCC6043 TaxID=2510645 RepID=UPI00101C13CD|nr:translocation/assembly module TamB domain-containing protein [Tropicimonas sp. IMCC6043]RYH08515.1 hypothetical protein EU800_15830 [Tropicimonas sp. IMCC6043]